MVVERRDFSEAMYSLVCSSGLSASVTVSTGIGGGPPPGPPGPPGPAPGAPPPSRLQAAVMAATTMN
jgi:hypothetical protein